MWKSFLQLLKPPHFVDEDKTRAAEVLHVIFLTLFIVLGILAFFTDHPITVFVTAGMSVAFFGLWLIMRRGMVKLTGWCLMIFMVAGVALIVYFNGTIRVPAASGFVACIVIAGLTLSNRATIVSAITISGILLVLYLAEKAGELPPVYYHSTGFLQWATYAGIMCITAVLLMLARNSILNALALARRNEAALAKLNENLRAEIAERQQVEQALRESEARYRTLLTTLPDGVLQTNTDGEILFASQQMLSMFKTQNIDEILGTKIISWVVPEDHQRARKSIQHVMSGALPTYNSYVFCLKDGSRFDGEVSAAAWLNAAGRSGGMITTVRDVTQRLKSERALRESEALYRTLVSTSPDGIGQTDVNGNLIYISPKLLSMFGLQNPDEVLGTNVAEWIIPEDRQRAMENARQAMSGTPTIYNNYTFFRKDGIRFAVELSSAAWQNADGQTGGIITVVRDITERLRVERALRESEERYRNLFELESDAIILVDMGRKKIWDANPAATRLYGYSRSELLSMNPLDLSAEPDKDLAIIRGGDPTPRVPLRHARSKDGKIFPIEATACYFNWQEKRLLLITARDITERVRTEDSLREYRERLEELVEERTAQLTAINQELESFSYSVAHDLRVPLRAINGFSQILLEDYSSRFDSEMLSYFNQIIAAGQRMNQLIDALLGLSRLTRSEITREEIDLGAMAHTVLEELHQREPARNVDVKISDGLIIKADRHLMRLVLENLLGNAWKFTAKSPNPYIELGRQDDDEKSAYFIRDNGAGFNMEYAGNLFGPFQRLHTEKEFPGTGIGLATVKRIIHRHGGEVWATGEIDKGATFYFTLP